jgi:hypothetical protein
MFFGRQLGDGQLTLLSFMIDMLSNEFSLAEQPGE